MIGTADVAQAVITRLKAVPEVSGLVGSEIREENWQGITHESPNIRVHIVRLVPFNTTSNCKFWVTDFTVDYRRYTPSSKPCADGLKAVADALREHRLGLAGVFVAEGAIVIESLPGPIPEAENAWMARGTFNCRLKEI